MKPQSSLQIELRNFLKEFSGQNVLLIPNQGNAGDCLILIATLMAMRDAGVEAEIADDKSDFTNKTVFLGGGGNLVGLYRGMRQSMEAVCSSQAKRIILLPHTVRANEDLIARLDDRVTFWCREQKSFDHVRRTNPNLDCRIGHDMAFHCDVEEFLNDPACTRAGPEFLISSLEHTRTSLDRISQLEVVRFMRTDKEARPSLTAGDLDVSNAFGKVADLDSSRLTAWCFVKTISAARRVVTDRLHVAITCALLGKPCELRDNNYSKNRDIFAYSLQNFSCITFDKRRNEAIEDRPPLRRSLLDRLSRHTRRLIHGRR